MPHAIEPIYRVSLSDCLNSLREAHDFVAKRAIDAEQEAASEVSSWGIETKRATVDLADGPDSVGKDSEKLAELINILATAERTIEAIEWFQRQYSDLLVRECHPSTSDLEDGNDIVLVDTRDEVRVRCEVCDVVSSNPSQNNKEKKDLASLGCSGEVPQDGVDRYIATSGEFATALSSPNRKWKNLHYRYLTHPTGLSHQTVMLKIESHG